MRRPNGNGASRSNGADPSPPRRFWVAGATGFLGSHLTALLQERGHEVVAISRNGGPNVQALDVHDEAAVAESARGADGAFLAFGKVSRDKNDAEELHRTNVVAMRHALGGLKRAGVPRVVVASSSGTIAIGTDPDVIFDEESQPPSEIISRFPYYRSKLYAEREALEANGPELAVIVVNPSLLLGPGDLNETSTGDVRRFLERGIPALPAGGMAFVDVRDAALGMLLAFERGKPGARYLLNAKNLTLAAFFQRLERMTGVPTPRLRLPASRPLALGLNDIFNRAVKAIGGEPPVDSGTLEMAQYYWYCNAERAERELGWHARDTGATLRDTVDDLVSRGVTPRSSRPYRVRGAD
jgi:dihydroflavonol-4-reductase